MLAESLGQGSWGWERGGKEKGESSLLPQLLEVYLTSHMAGHPLSADCEGTFLVPLHQIPGFPTTQTPRQGLRGP